MEKVEYLQFNEAEEMCLLEMLEMRDVDELLNLLVLSERV